MNANMQEIEYELGRRQKETLALRAERDKLQRQRDALLAAAKDVESKIADFRAGRINWRPDDFLYRLRAAIEEAEKHVL